MVILFFYSSWWYSLIMLRVDLFLAFGVGTGVLVGGDFWYYDLGVWGEWKSFFFVLFEHMKGNRKGRCEWQCGYQWKVRAPKYFLLKYTNKMNNQELNQPSKGQKGLPWNAVLLYHHPTEYDPIFFFFTFVYLWSVRMSSRYQIRAKPKKRSIALTMTHVQKKNSSNDDIWLKFMVLFFFFFACQVSIT